VSVWTGSELLVWAGIPETSDTCSMDQSGGLLCGAAAVFDGAAYVPATDTWRTIAAGPVPAGGAPTQVIPQGAWTGSELVVWGGSGSPIAAAYNPTTDRWRKLPAGPLDAREAQTVVAWAGRVAVLGGQKGHGPSEPRLDGAVLDPASGEWTSLPDLPAGNSRSAGGLVSAIEADGRLFVVSPVTAEAYVLEVGGREWRHLGSAGVDGYLSPLGVASGRWLFVGGRPQAQQAVAAALDLVSGQWHAATAPNGPPTGYLSAGAGDRVLAVAARFAHAPDPTVALAWDPDTGTWTELAQPPLANRAAAAVAWTGSELVVWGGADTDGLGGPSFADGGALRP
jgi:hypothetical protein